MNANMLIDAVGMIDYDLIEAYVEMDQMLMSGARAKKKRRLSAAAMASNSTVEYSSRRESFFGSFSVSVCRSSCSMNFLAKENCYLVSISIKTVPSGI